MIRIIPLTYVPSSVSLYLYTVFTFNIFQVQFWGVLLLLIEDIHRGGGDWCIRLDGSMGSTLCSLVGRCNRFPCDVTGDVFQRITREAAVVLLKLRHSRYPRGVVDGAWLAMRGWDQLSAQRVRQPVEALDRQSGTWWNHIFTHINQPNEMTEVGCKWYVCIYILSINIYI